MKTQHPAKSRDTSSYRLFLVPLVIFFSLFLHFSISTPVNADPVPIENVDELQAMQDDLDGEYFLANNIDASDTENWNDEAGFIPVGDRENYFTGTFDGRGHTISNFYINRDPDNEHNIGLFGCIREATVENVGLVDVDITGGCRSGGLVAHSYRSLITNCYATGSVNGLTAIGGLVGNFNLGSITNCYASVSVNGEVYSLGGLVGFINSSSISNCYATGSVHGSFEIGGLAGAADNDCSISNSFATGSVNGGHMVGGLIGNNEDSEVTNCYATGSVNCGFGAGGLIGKNDGSIVTNSYATGSVRTDREVDYLGGLVGESEEGHYTNNFWNTETTGIDVGTGNGDEDGITGATTEEMQDQATFEDVRWDFEDIWMMRGYPHFQWETDVLGGFLKGIVFDVETDSLLENATVNTSYGFSTLSDTTGYWYLERFVGDTFSVTLSKLGYNDSTYIGRNVEYEDTLEISIGLLHPELALSEEEIVDELEYGASAEHHLTIRNEGNGLLEWSMKLRLTGESGVDPWALRGSFNAGQTVEDNRLQGVVFIDDHYYVSGGGNDVNMIYVLNMDGNMVRSFPQFGESRNGMKDLAWDGALIWGAADDTVYGFNTEGDSVTSFQGPFNPNSAITWDPDRELLWISSVTTDIHGYDRQDAHDQENELSRKGLLIYGLANLPEESTSLYIFNTPGDNRQVIYKMNPDNGDTVFVRELTPENGGSPAGAFITDQYDMYGSWVFMDIVNDGSDDRIDIWQLKPNTGWMEIEPSSGTIEPDENQELVLTLNAAGLDSTLEWQGEMIFSQSVGGGEAVIPITLTIRTNAVSDNDLQQPSEFGISSVYPNPFNSTTRITYGLPVSAPVSLKMYDLSGREVMKLAEGNKQAGIHQAILNAPDMPSGLYFVKLKASNHVFTQKVMLIR